MRRIASSVAALAIGISVSLVGLFAAGVAAHEQRTIGDGKYDIVIGFMNEPVFAGDKSGLEFWVTEAAAATPAAGASEGEDEGVPVEGLDKTLKAEVIFEDQTMELPLSAMWDEPGGYYSVFFPTTAGGDYTFRVYGKIGDTEVDESFTSGPETFGPVEDPTPLRFPAQ